MEDDELGVVSLASGTKRRKDKAELMKVFLQKKSYNCCCCYGSVEEAELMEEDKLSGEF
jgi:hypothetical protein